MKRLFFLLILSFVLFHFTNGQHFYSPGITVEFIFTKKRIVSKSELDFIIKYNNETKDTLSIFSAINEGSKFDLVGNIYIEIEELKKGKFVRREFVSAGKYIYQDTLPSRPMMSILPHSIVKKCFNLMTRMNFLKKGDYRVKVFLLRLDSNLKDMQYVESKWFTFKVLRDIIIK